MTETAAPRPPAEWRALWTTPSRVADLIERDIEIQGFLKRKPAFEDAILDDAGRANDLRALVNAYLAGTPGGYDLVLFALCYLQLDVPTNPEPQAPFIGVCPRFFAHQRLKYFWPDLERVAKELLELGNRLGAARLLMAVRILRDLDEQHLFETNAGAKEKGLQVAVRLANTEARPQ